MSVWLVEAGFYEERSPVFVACSREIAVDAIKSFRYRNRDDWHWHDGEFGVEGPFSQKTGKPTAFTTFYTITNLELIEEPDA